ncbi:MAG: DUF2298 domain-containing protein [Chloroflexota bacterium]|jgi:YYY domain-containing protein|nr:DUF2298 domain-containing protein [Chloroflexota bacterium]
MDRPPEPATPPVAVGPAVPARRSRRRFSWTGLALAAIALLALGLRVFGLNWDDGHHLHPDERFLTIVETSIQWPGSIAEYFDPSQSPLNPYGQPDISFFVYGTFPLFLVKALAEITGYTTYDTINLVGRAVSAVFDVGTVLMLFLLTRRLFDRRVALLAALLAALSVLSIQLSHFFAVDTFSTFFVTAALYFMLRVYREQYWYLFAGLGLVVGLALASKLSSGLILPLVAIYVVASYIRDRDSAARPAWTLLLAGLLAAGLVAAFTFRIAQPYAFTGSNLFDFQLAREFLDAINQQRQIQEGTYDWPPGIQWAGTTPYLFPLKNIVLWGLGPALGVTGVLALAGASWRLWRRRDWALFLPVVWVLLNFAYFGGLVLKTMRYYQPTYPMLALLAAWLLLKAWDGWGRSGRARALRVALFAVVIGGTALWALAFTGIYSRPVSRLAASEWIHNTIPDGTPVATEHWDDALPLALPGFGGAGRYELLQLPLYDDDTPQKRERVLDIVTRAEYIILSSNRLSDSIPRMPRRFPMTIRYYEALFSGELGFAEIAEFTSRPSLAGFEFVDDSAEEAFTVYDHPRVRIFQKTAEFDANTARTILNEVDISGAIRLLPRDAAPPELLLSAADRENLPTTGALPEQLFGNSTFAGFPAVAWYALVLLAGLAAWPLVALALGRLPDGGYFAARPLGLLLVVYPGWLLASLRWTPFGRGPLLGGLLTLVALGVAVGWLTRRRLWRTIKGAWPAMAIGEAVFLGAFLFLLSIRMANPDLWHTTFGGEKPMDFAHLNAMLRTDYFPPYDPWWAGGYINYYYFGQLYTAGPARLLGIPAEVAYNLGLPAMFALAAGTVYSFGFNLWRGVGWGWRGAVGVGLLAVALTLLLGNLDSLVQLFQIAGQRAGGDATGLAALAQVPGTLLGGSFAADFDFWRPTRVIEHTVNEFPYFTFLYGDLHPHLLDLAFTLVTLLGVVALVLAPGATRTDGRTAGWLGGGRMAPLLLIAVTLGVHRVVNPWDFPTYLILAAFGLMYSIWRGSGRLSWSLLLWPAVAAGALMVVSLLLFAPFHENFEVFFSGTEPTPGTTPLNRYLLLFGMFFLILFSFAGLSFAPRRVRGWYSAGLRVALVSPVRLLRYVRLAGTLGRWRRLPARWVLAFPALALAVLVIGAAGGQAWSTPGVQGALIAAGLGVPVLWLIGGGRVPPVPWLVILPAVILFYALIGDLAWSTRAFQPVAIALAVAAALKNRDHPLRFVPMALLAGALLLTTLPEWVTLEGDIGRLNTVFKTYFQAWVLLSLASAVALPQLVGAVRRRWGGWFSITGGALLAAIAIGIFGAALYPLGATPVKIDLRIAHTEATLDGFAYMEEGSFPDRGVEIELRHDRDAFRWIMANIPGRPTVLEASVDIYRWGSRVSINTGLPTVLGWDWHEKQQRWPYDHAVDTRRRDIELAYNTRSEDEFRAVLERYDVDLVYVGELERAYYPGGGLAKFDDLVGRGLEVIYENAAVRIYRVAFDGA